MAIALAAIAWRGLPPLPVSVRGPHCDSDVDEAEFTELVAMALTAGHGLPAAVLLAAEVHGGPVAEQARRQLRAGEPGGGALEVFRVAWHARSTGAPLVASVETLASRLRRDLRARRRARLQRLPVRLLFPLALLILPGTLILTLGPILLGALQRLGT